MTGPIFLVEDDPNDVFFLTDAFKKAGIERPIEVARDGREALAYLKKRVTEGGVALPCLVILDLKLPIIMGLDVLRYIRNELGLLTVVVVLSSSAENSDVIAAYTAGANAYLVKPTDTSKLIELSRSIGAFWLAQNTSPHTP